MRTLDKQTPLLQSHKKSSSFEFLRNNTFKFTRSIHGFSVFGFFFSFFLFFFNYQGKTPHKIYRSASKAFTEYLLNYKTFSGFPSLEKTAADLTRPVSQQLVPDSFFWFFNFWRIRQNHFWKEIFIGTERKTSIVFDKLDISNEEDFCRQLYMFFLL